MATELYGYLIVDNDMAINTLQYETDDYKLLPGSIAYVVGGGAYMLTPSNRWQFLDPEIQKIVLPVFKNVSSSGGGGGGGSSWLVVNAVYDGQTDETTLDKTWNEIKNAVASGEPTYIFYQVDETSYNYRSVTEVNVTGGTYSIHTNVEEYYADSADSYPSFSSGGGI